MQIVTYKNGMSKSLKSKTAIMLKHFVCGRTHKCLSAIVNVTYVTQCYNIKSNTVVKSLKKKYMTHRQNGTLYFLIMVVRVS